MLNRYAGGAWINSNESDTSKNYHPVPHHAPFAANILKNKGIEKHERKQYTADPAVLKGKPDGTPVGKSGEVALEKAQEELPADENSPKNSENLRQEGWIQVRIGDGTVQIFAHDIEHLKKPGVLGHLVNLVQQYGSVAIRVQNPDLSATVTSDDLAGQADEAAASLLRKLARCTLNVLNGLGKWSAH
jgi:hypothetical protein